MWKLYYSFPEKFDIQPYKLISNSINMQYILFLCSKLFQLVSRLQEK